MFLDPLKLNDLANGNVHTLAATDIGGGSSTRTVNNSSTHKLTLTVSNVASNENGVVPTTRTLVRLDRSIFDATLVKPAWIKQSAYVVLSAPSHSSFVGDNTVAKQLANLLSFFLTDGANTDLTNPPLGEADQTTNFEATVLRLQAGEI